MFRCKAETATTAVKKIRLVDKITNKCEDARVDISAKGFWQNGQLEFYDVVVFYSMRLNFRNKKLEMSYFLKYAGEDNFLSLFTVVRVKTHFPLKSPIIYYVQILI